MFRLTLATRNAHKRREFAQILGPHFEVLDLEQAANFPVVEETGATFEENAILKAVAVSRALSGLVVADDSGLEVFALNGAPGVYSARYAGAGATDSQNVEKLLRELEGCASEKRGARFCCVIALAQAGEVITILDGELEGQITTPAQGDGGFGYDPVFVPKGYDRTLAELGDKVKNRISHRAMAIAKLREFL